MLDRTVEKILGRQATSKDYMSKFSFKRYAVFTGKDFCGCDSNVTIVRLNSLTRAEADVAVRQMGIGCTELYVEPFDLEILELLPRDLTIVVLCKVEDMKLVRLVIDSYKVKNRYLLVPVDEDLLDRGILMDVNITNFLNGYSRNGYAKVLCESCTINTYSRANEEDMYDLLIKRVNSDAGNITPKGNLVKKAIRAVYSRLLYS